MDNRSRQDLKGVLLCIAFACFWVCLSAGFALIVAKLGISPFGAVILLLTWCMITAATARSFGYWLAERF